MQAPLAPEGVGGVGGAGGGGERSSAAALWTHLITATLKPLPVRRPGAVRDTSPPGTGLET